MIGLGNYWFLRVHCIQYSDTRLASTGNVCRHGSGTNARCNRAPLRVYSVAANQLMIALATEKWWSFKFLDGTIKFQYRWLLIATFSLSFVLLILQLSAYWNNNIAAWQTVNRCCVEITNICFNNLCWCNEVSDNLHFVILLTFKPSTNVVSWAFMGYFVFSIAVATVVLITARTVRVIGTQNFYRTKVSKYDATGYIRLPASAARSTCCRRCMPDIE